MSGIIQIGLKGKTTSRPQQHRHRSKASFKSPEQSPEVGRWSQGTGGPLQPAASQGRSQRGLAITGATSFMSSMGLLIPFRTVSQPGLSRSIVHISIHLPSSREMREKEKATRGGNRRKPRAPWEAQGQTLDVLSNATWHLSFFL